MDHEKALAKGLVARIGMTGAVLTHKPFDRPEVKISGEILDHIAATAYVISILLSANQPIEVTHFVGVWQAVSRGPVRGWDTGQQ